MREGRRTKIELFPRQHLCKENTQGPKIHSIRVTAALCLVAAQSAYLNESSKHSFSFSLEDLTLYFRSHVSRRATDRVAEFIVISEDSSQSIVDQTDVSVGRDENVLEFQISERDKRKRGEEKLSRRSPTDTRFYSDGDTVGRSPFQPNSTSFDHRSYGFWRFSDSTGNHRSVPSQEIVSSKRQGQSEAKGGNLIECISLLLDGTNSKL